MSQPIFTDGLGYEGKVTLTLKSDNLILNSRTYKNSGTDRLFEFLGNCLAGSFDKALKDLPSHIRLLYNKEETPDPSKATNVEKRTEPQPWIQPPVVDLQTAQVRVIYSFEVPKTAISADKKFNQVALYSAQNSSMLENFSAYYFITTGSKDKFYAEDTSTWPSSAVLLIEWELILSNKNVFKAQEGN